MTTMASIAAASMRYLSIPIPRRDRLDAGLDAFEANLTSASPEDAKIAVDMDALTATIGIRTSSGTICEEFLAEKREQIIRITEQAASTRPATTLPPLHRFLVEAYSAAAITRDEGVFGDPSSLYRRLMAWRFDSLSADSAKTLGALVKEATDEAHAHVLRYREVATFPEAGVEEGVRTIGASGGKAAGVNENL